jgi:hypothetical protein
MPTSPRQAHRSTRVVDGRIVQAAFVREEPGAGRIAMSMGEPEGHARGARARRGALAEVMTN